MKIKFPAPQLTVAKNQNASSPAYGGITCIRRLRIRGFGFFIATRRNTTYSFSAATLATACSQIRANPGNPYSINDNVLVYYVSGYKNVNLLWREENGIVYLDDLPTPIDSYDIDTTHVFSSSTANYWHNSLVINNKTNKTSATVTVNTTTRNPRALTMGLLP